MHSLSFVAIIGLSTLWVTTAFAGDYWKWLGSVGRLCGWSRRSTPRRPAPSAGSYTKNLAGPRFSSALTADFPWVGMVLSLFSCFFWDLLWWQIDWFSVLFSFLFFFFLPNSDAQATINIFFKNVDDFAAAGPLHGWNGPPAQICRVGRLFASSHNKKKSNFLFFNFFIFFYLFSNRPKVRKGNWKLERKVP